MKCKNRKKDHFQSYFPITPPWQTSDPETLTLTLTLTL